MIPLRRHQLVHLLPEAWNSLTAEADDDAAQAGFVHWATHSLPLVVARQSCRANASVCNLGFPLPACWGRQRLTVQVPLAQLSRAVSFPDARDVATRLQPDAQRALLNLCEGLKSLGMRASVYGSHGWQWVTGLSYVHPASDLDLLITVADAAAADAAAALMAACSPATPALDGELVFADGTAVAWREWRVWRSGRAAQILLKRIDGIALESGPHWLAQNQSSNGLAGA